MKKEWMIKTLALGVIVLFISAGVVSAYNVNQDIASQLSQKENNLVYPTGMFIEVLRGRARGFALSAKLIGFRGKIVKINFEYLRFDARKLFPYRWETFTFYWATAYMFNVNQIIPQDPFWFESEWVVAIVIHL